MFTYFGASKKSMIQVDASGKGFGAALVQEDKPIALASNLIKEIAQHYANIKQKLQVVVVRCKKFQTYIHILNWEWV